MKQSGNDKTLLLLFLASSCLSLAHLAAAISNSVCKEEIPTASDPPKPNMNYSFTTEIAGKWIDIKAMAYIYESHNANENKLAYDSLWLGNEYSEIYDLTRRSLIFSMHDRCTYLPDYKAAQNFSDNGMRSLEILLNLGGVWKYKGETKINNVEVEQWRSCGGWSYLANFTADYYFTKKEQNPFRLEMKGVKKPSEFETSKDFHRIYEYFSFRRVNPSPAEFRPPPGESCAGQKEMPLPIATSATYHVQEQIIENKIFTNSKVIFDKITQLSVEETEETITIFDFKQKYQFEVNKDTQKCTRKPFYRFRIKKNDKETIHLSTLKHFFMDEEIYIYNGVHWARGIACDLYTKKSRGARELGAYLVEVYIARKEVITSGVNLVPSSMKQPVQLVLKSGLDKHEMVVKRQYDIYDFNPEESPDFNSFNLSPCFDTGKSIKFNIVFECESNLNFSWKWKQDTMKSVAEIVSDTLEISLIRVSVSGILVSDGQIKVLVTLYDAIENETSMFETASETENRIDIDTKDTVDWHVFHNPNNSPSVCLEYCLHTAKLNFDRDLDYCWAFQFDKVSKNCTFFFVSPFHLDKPKEDLYYNERVDLYRRIPGNQRHNITLYEAWKLFQTRVNAGSVNYTDHKGSMLKAITSSMEQSRMEHDILFNNPIDNFFYKFWEIVGDPIEVVIKTDRNVCAKHCMFSIDYNYRCEAFHFDEKTKSCSFYNSSFYKESYNPAQFVYVRDYSKNFEKIFGISILSHSEDIVFTNVIDINTCAGHCVNNQQFNCQSFEMCGDVCLIGRRHFFNYPPREVKQNISCFHYTRNYLQDYTKTTFKQALNNSNQSHIEVEVKDIGLKRCATICSTSGYYDCDVMEFCDNDNNRICRLLTSLSNRNSSRNVAFHNSSTCNIYPRKPGYTRSLNNYQSHYQSIPTTPKSSNVDSDEGFSQVEMAGTALGMFFLGFIFIIIVGYCKLRRSTAVSDKDIKTDGVSTDNDTSTSEVIISTCDGFSKNDKGTVNVAFSNESERTMTIIEHSVSERTISKNVIMNKENGIKNSSDIEVSRF